MFNRSIIITEDGSSSLYVPLLDEAYHSIHGAIQESEHIFIAAGLNAEIFSSMKNIKIFEVGFGTGLNALLTIIYAENRIINYHTIELYPLQEFEWKQLNYSVLEKKNKQIFYDLHQSPWEIITNITDSFTLLKNNIAMQNISLSENEYDLVYFDAFSPDSQPEMWSESVFLTIFKAMKSGGILMTYSTKGIVKRTLQNVGFKIEKLAGPPGKREILRAYKL